jgi:hypothetical protein
LLYLINILVHSISILFYCFLYEKSIGVLLINREFFASPSRGWKINGKFILFGNVDSGYPRGYNKYIVIDCEVWAKKRYGQRLACFFGTKGTGVSVAKDKSPQRAPWVA